MTGFCIDITERKQAEEAPTFHFQRVLSRLASMYGRHLCCWTDEGKGEFANQSSVTSST